MADETSDRTRSNVEIYIPSWTRTPRSIFLYVKTGSDCTIPSQSLSLKLNGPDSPWIVSKLPRLQVPGSLERPTESPPHSSVPGGIWSDADYLQSSLLAVDRAIYSGIW